MERKAARILPQIRVAKFFGLETPSPSVLQLLSMSSLPDYFLETPRLGFRRWTTQDLPLALAIWGDPEVTRFVGGPFSPEQVQAKLDREIANMASHNVQYWPMFLLSTGEHAGCAGLRPPRAGREGFEMGFYLRPAYWGMGLAAEAGRGVVQFAFATLGVKTLYAAHHPANAASGRVLEKLGFRYSHDELYPPTGLMHRSYVLAAPS
jgi:RimJ/RimL family protein N-acetyltransferase